MQAPTWNARFLEPAGVSALAIAALAIGGLLAEAGARLFLGGRLYLHVDERNLLFRYDERLGWFPIRNSRGTLDGSRRVSVEHNSRGFRDVELTRDGRPRVVFLGDSFVWGYDVEAGERFTERLRTANPCWCYCNLGVSGYGTDQEFLLLQQEFEQYQPRIVILVFSVDNDRLDNTTNVRYHGYYKPYFTVEHSNLRLHGVPVPKSANYLFANHPWLAWSYVVRGSVLMGTSLLHAQVTTPDPTLPIIDAMNRLVQSHCGRFAVALTESDSALEGGATARGIEIIRLSGARRYPGFGGHWTPEGHAFVGRVLNDWLRLQETRVLGRTSAGCAAEGS